MTTTINASTAGAGGLITTADNSGLLQLQTAGTAAVTVDSSQNVGIGTSTPAAKLDIRGSSTFLVNATNPTAWISSDSALTTKSFYHQFNTTSNIAISGTYTNHPYAFYTNNTERMRIDSAGNVGIGTNNPQHILDIATANGTATRLRLLQSGVTNYSWSIPASTDALTLVYGASTERMRIDSSGNLLVGTTAASSYHQLLKSVSLNYAVGITNTNASAPYGLVISLNGVTGGTGGGFLTCVDNANRLLIAGNGNVTNVNNSYGAISDRKLKENIVDATPKLDKLMQVQIRNYNLIGDYEQFKQIGVIADELEPIFPSLIEEKVDRDEEGNDLGTTTKSVKYSVFVPILIKAIQEQQAIITDLKARIETLETK